MQRLSPLSAEPSPALPDDPAQWPVPATRREFLEFVASGVALASLAACNRQPVEYIVPQEDAPEFRVPGKPLFYASALTRNGYGRGVLVETHEGRPTRLDGNKDHPTTLGALDPITQAAIMDFYDPSRSRGVRHGNEEATWSDFTSAFLDATRGKGLRVLTGGVSSPTLAAMMQRLGEQRSDFQWHTWEPLNSDAQRQATRNVYGKTLEVVPDLGRADVVLTLDCDFLTDLPGSLRHARDFVEGRRPEHDAEPPRMNRLYAVQSSPMLAAIWADHHLNLRPGEVATFAAALARRLGVEVAAPDDLGLPPHVQEWLEPMARDLESHRGHGLVLVGDTQPTAVHEIGLLINHALGNTAALTLREPITAGPHLHAESLRILARDIESGDVQTLVIAHCNPALTAPADLGLRALLPRVPNTIHIGLERDETAELCTWHVPAAHELASWGDCRGHDGTITIQQPTIDPLFGGKSLLRVLGLLLGRDREAYWWVRDYWEKRGIPGQGDDFAAAWRSVLDRGVVPDTAAPKLDLQPQHDVRPQVSAAPKEGLDVVFRPHPGLWDGRYANNIWLLELPDPFTKLTWDNAVWMAPKTAEAHDLITEDVIRLRSDDRSVEIPVMVLPGHPQDTLTVHLGFGRRGTGPAGKDVGTDVYPLRLAPGFLAGVQIEKTGKRAVLATTQHHHDMAGFHLVRRGTLAEYRHDPRKIVEVEEKVHTSLRPKQRPLNEYRWGMAVDLTRCIGCNACVIACQAENNVPVVGKDQVLVHREMHWLRIDRYFDDAKKEYPETMFQPRPCMHCENAPCESVCPVGATVHGDGGLNQMIYNRCIGTRYCSNNCPYKVRRFNFLHYVTDTDPLAKMPRNPDVTVRAQGVMEKCTYCVQRINAARIAAKRERGGPIHDGEVVPACQSACPTVAIMFGDTGDPSTRVSRRKEDPIDYSILEELNTVPRTTYSARLRHPNPDMPEHRS